MLFVLDSLIQSLNQLIKQIKLFEVFFDIFHNQFRLKLHRNSPQSNRQFISRISVADNLFSRPSPREGFRPSFSTHQMISGLIFTPAYAYCRVQFATYIHDTSMYRAGLCPLNLPTSLVGYGCESTYSLFHIGLCISFLRLSMQESVLTSI